MRYLLIFSLVYCTSLVQLSAQHLGTTNQYFKITIPEEALELKGKKEIRTLSRADFRIHLQADSILFFVKGRQALNKLLKDKKTSITFILSTQDSITIDNKSIRDQMKKNITAQTKVQAKKIHSEGIAAVEKKIRQDYPEHFSTDSWKKLVEEEPSSFVDKLSLFFTEQAKQASKKDSAVYMAKLASYRTHYEKNTQSDLEELRDMEQKPLKYFSTDKKIYTTEWPFVIQPQTMVGSATEVSVVFKRKKQKLLSVSFDTLYADIPGDLPITDSSSCGGDMIQDEVDAMEKSKNVTPCKKVTGFECYGSFTPAFMERKEFRVPFEKNEVKDLNGAVQPAYDYLKAENLSLKKISIKAFASVEGDSTANMALAKSRSQVMIDALQKREKDSIEASIECSENWAAFFKDLPLTPFAKWKNKDTVELRTLVNDTINSKQLEPWLSKHRYAYMELYSERKLSNEEKLQVLRKQYTLLVDYLTKAQPENSALFEAKIAALRNWLIKQYLAGHFKKQELDPFFHHMTPKLSMANFYHQFKILYSNKPLLGSSMEDYFLTSFESSFLNIDVLLIQKEQEPKRAKTIDLSIEQNMIFQRQCMLSMIAAIQKKKMDATVLDKIEISQQPAYMPLQVLLDYGKTQTAFVINKKKDGEGKSITFREYHTEVREQSYDYKLNGCEQGTIYCNNSPFYPMLKEYLLKPGKMSVAEKSLYPKILFLFLEVQVTETNEWARTLYDKDFNMVRIDELLTAHPIKNQCKVQKDKIMLELSRKAAVLAHAEGKDAIEKKYLNTICAYYITHKNAVQPYHAETIVRMLLAFDKAEEYEKEYLEMAYGFMKKIGVGTNSRFKNLEGLLERLRVISETTIVRPPKTMAEEAFKKSTKD